MNKYTNVNPACAKHLNCCVLCGNDVDKQSVSLICDECKTEMGVQQALSLDHVHIVEASEA